MIPPRCHPRCLPVDNRRLRAQGRRLQGAEHTTQLLRQELAVTWR